MKTLNRAKSTSLGIVLLAVLMLSACSPKDPFPLSEAGPYDFGTRGGFSQLYVFTDSSRADREVSLMIWYPAKLPENAEPSDYNIDAEPDLSGAPYTLIVSSAKVGSYFGAHLASHGFPLWFSAMEKHSRFKSGHLKLIRALNTGLPHIGDTKKA